MEWQFSGANLFKRDVMSIERAVPNGRGLGVFYWDASWTGVPGDEFIQRTVNSPVVLDYKYVASANLRLKFGTAANSI